MSEITDATKMNGRPDERYFGKLREVATAVFLVTPVPGGEKEILLSREDILQFKADPATFVAKQFDASVEEYLMWREETQFGVVSENGK